MMFPGRALDVLLLQPPSPPFLDVDREFEAGLGVGESVARSEWGHSRTPFFNHSLAWTAGVLRDAGYRVEFVDAQALRLNDRQVVERVADLRPAVLLALVNVPSLYGDLELLRAVKSSASDVTIVTTGTTCRLIGDVVAETGGADVVLRGEPEACALGLIEAIRAGDDTSRVPGVWSREATTEPPQSDFVVDLDSLPMTPFDLLPMDLYRGRYFGAGQPIAPIVSSKGCPFGCGYYCPYPSAYGSRVRYRSPARVVDEIEVLAERWGVRHLIFRDQNFTLDVGHVEALCSEIVKRGIKVSWVCESRLRLIDDETPLELMRAAGCEQINFGLETADQEMFESVGKPGTTFEQITRAVTMTRDAGLRSHAHVIVGLPGESWSSVYRTARTLRGLEFDSLNFGFLTPYPGTRFYEEARARGHVKSEDWSKYTHAEPVVRTERMSLAELKLAQLILHNTFGEFRIHKNAARKLKRGLIKAVSALRPTVSPASGPGE